MRILVALVVVGLLAMPALAGQNPDIRLFITFTEGQYDNYIEAPAQYQNIYTCADCLSRTEGEGLWGVAWMFERTFGGTHLATTNLLNGTITPIGNPDTGVAVASGGLCINSDPPGTGIVCLASHLYLYTTPGTVSLVGHPTDGNVAADCDNVLDEWCVYQNGALGAGQVPPDGDPDCQECPEPNPVEDATWGTIKAMYR